MNRDYQTPTDLDQTYTALVHKNQQDRERIDALVNKRLARQKVEEEKRKKWISYTMEEKVAQVARLKEACNELIQKHPDYKTFMTAEVIWPFEDPDSGEEMCKIHWNGTAVHKISGWGLIDRVIKACDITLVTQRYIDKIRKQTKEEDL